MKKKSICAVELTDDGKVKRFYTLKIKDFSAKSLGRIFDKHISKEAKITTDNRKGYKPISKDYILHKFQANRGITLRLCA